MIEILAEAGSDCALLDHGERRRQGAGAQKDGEIVGRLHREIAGNLPRPAEDGFADDRRRNHLVIKYDGERLADILLRRLREFPRTARVEAEADDWFAIALVETRLSVDEIGAGDKHPLLDEKFLVALAVKNFGILRRVARDCLLRRHRLIDHAKIELRGLAENLLQPRRVLQTRHLDENATGALALDRRLDQAELVDAALDDLDGLVDRLADPLHDRSVRRSERNQTAGLGYVDVALSAGAEYAGQRLRKLAQLTDRVINVTLAGYAHFHAIAVNSAPGEGNAILAQNAQHVVGYAL